MQAVTLGPSGTYSHRAAAAIADEVSFRQSVTAVVEDVVDGNAERGVVPIENSIEGSVGESLDALVEHDVAVVREIVTPVRHAFLAQRPDVETVASHSQALAQCRAFLDSEYPDAERRAVASTAAGVDLALEDPTIGAIARPGAADGNLQVFAEGIQDRDSNATRFFVLAPAEERSISGGKSSLVIYPGTNYPGLLLEILEPFADRDLNLSRIESRPSGRRLGDYVFHLDFEAGLYERRAEAAVDQIEASLEDGWVRRLGSYDVEHVVE
jgi:prephenate dehydratase